MKKNNSIRVLLLIIVCTIVTFFIFKYKRQIRHIKIHELRAYILSFGQFAAIVFILIYSLKPILLIVPSAAFSILAGTIFGPYKAFGLSMISSFFAATLAFYLARMLGKPFVNKLLRGKALNLDSNIEKHGFKIMLIMRLSIVFPYDALSYASGLTKMKYRDFILGTLIGIAPEMLSYSFMGKHIRNPFSLKFILPLVVVGIIGIGSYCIYQRTTKKEEI